ncbi:MAG TPA: LacI family DNA-binding transcriptional regulator [Balneolaceae bacterium]|nr:LacI family DNA-binding transcriptional regulator [Balneolaceae bacterium]
MEKLNIDKIAKLALVSRSVVSRVLNNHPNVSDEARKRVMDVVTKYNYRPSSVARSLATDSMFEIGIFATRRGDEALGNGFWTLLHLGIFEECIKRGYFVTLSFLSTKMKDEAYNFVLNERRFDGYILLTQEVTDLVYNVINDRNIPTVLVGHADKNEGIFSIDVDNIAGGYKATKHLIGLGHKKIGIILAGMNLKESVDRLKGYKRAMSESDLPINEDYIAIGDYSQRFGYETMHCWLQDHPEMTGLFCASDTLAMGALLALYKSNVQVPEQFSVIGFDDLNFSKYLAPPLTTIQQPIFKKGKKAARLLIDQIEKKVTDPININLEPELIIRESSGRIAG